MALDLLTLSVAFVVMLNPFALFLYLQPIMKDLTHRNFLKVLFKASLTSFGIYALFLIVGDVLFRSVFQINFESFRIFGGIVIFSFAYLFIVKGQKAFIQMKENLDDLASEIALPFMVGAGTISLTILMSNQYPVQIGAPVIAAILVVNYGIIATLKTMRDRLKREKLRVAFDKNMEMLLRLNGFFVGAIGVNMIITGIRNVFF